MIKLVISEKPSVGMSLSAVLGADKRMDGYMEGNGYIVSWCFGHLAELANADAYDEKYAKWRYDDLPIVPNPLPSRGKMNIMRALANLLIWSTATISYKDWSTVLTA